MLLLAFVIGLLPNLLLRLYFLQTLKAGGCACQEFLFLLLIVLESLFPPGLFLAAAFQPLTGPQGFLLQHRLLDFSLVDKAGQFLGILPGFFQHFLGRCEFVLRLCHFGLALADFPLQGLNLCTAVEEARFLMASATTREGAARIDELTCECHQTQFLIVLPGQGQGVIKVIHHQRTGQQEVCYLAVLSRYFHQTAGPVQHPRLPCHLQVRHRALDDGGKGQEGGPPQTLLLQEGYSYLGGVSISGDQILLGRAQGHLDGSDILRRHLHELCHGSCHALAPGLAGFQHRLGCLAKALIGLLHAL